MSDNLDIPTFLRQRGTHQILVRIPQEQHDQITAIRALSPDGASTAAVVTEALRRSLPGLLSAARAVAGCADPVVVEEDA